MATGFDCGIVDCVSDRRPFEESLKEDYNHGVHAMVWARNSSSKKVLGKFDPRAAILMHMRFDGHLGFPGGKVDENVNGLQPEVAKGKVVEALIRELEEEINIDTSKISIVWKDNYHVTFKHSIRRYYLHFFSVEVPLAYFEELEVAALKSKEYGDEVMGNFRVPLYTMEDEYLGLPAFLNNKFIGTAKQELIMACLQLGLLSRLEIQEALMRSVAQQGRIAQ